MQKTHSHEIETIIEKILPITQLRRNPTEAIKYLEETGGFIITKDGKPVGKLLPIKKAAKSLSISEKLKKLKALKGGLRLTPDLDSKKINQLIKRSYEEMLP